MNTQIEYIYANGSKDSTVATAIVAGELTAEDEKAIYAALDCGRFFIPSHVGLPECRPCAFDHRVIHPWFELEENAFTSTEDAPTVPLTISELVEDFKAIRRRETDMPRRNLVGIRILTAGEPSLRHFIVPAIWRNEELESAVDKVHRIELEKGHYVETEDISTESYAEVGMIPYYIPTMDVLHRNLRQEAMEADGIENACCNTCNYAEGPVCLAADETINDFDSQRLCCRCEQLYDVAYMPGEKQAWKSKRYIIKNEELLQDPFRLYTVLAKYDAEIAAAMEAGFVPEAEDISPIED